MVADVGGKPLRHWDSRAQIFRHRYDDLQRPSHLFVQKTIAESTGQPGETPDDLSERLLVRTIYGEALDPAGPAPTNASSASPAQQLNLRGQAYLLYDCAGGLKSDRFDFKGNLLSSTRRMARDYHSEPKWNASGNDITNLTDPTQIQTMVEPLLDAPVLPPTTTFTVFTVQTEYDALNRVTKRTTADLSVTSPTYNVAGLLETVSAAVRGAPATTVVSNIDYNARGQRILYEYADPTSTAVAVTCQVSYTYDPFTFRLTNLVTHRLGNGADVSPARLQDLLYTYDPVGNVVEMDDNANTAPIFSGSTPIPGNGFYRYDALYRLILAKGREHPGQQQPTGTFDIPLSTVPHRNDLQALVAYTERYTYDQVGNIQSIAHTSAPSATWTRNYQYESQSNRLTGNNDPDATGGTASYTYTGNGAMRKMAHLPVIEWDYADRMRHANKNSGGGDVFFTYDGSGQRVRKVWEHGQFDERIYVGGWETFRSRAGSITSTPTLERETLHVMDDKRRIAMVETKTIDAGGPTPPRWRFQLGNLLDSAILELDAASRVISYEEYHPYGSSAFRSFDSTELSLKRYRYTGKERDEETGLYYHGARYYAEWLGRWTAADPAGVGADGPNLYSYVLGNPLRRTDPAGMRGHEHDHPKPRTEHQPKPKPKPEPQRPQLTAEGLEKAGKSFEKAGVKFGSLWDESKSQQVAVNEKYWSLKYKLISQKGEVVHTFTPDSKQDIKDVVSGWVNRTKPTGGPFTIDVELSFVGKQGASAALSDIEKNGHHYRLECLTGTMVFQLYALKQAFHGTDAQFDQMYKSFKVTIPSAEGREFKIVLPGYGAVADSAGFAIKGLPSGEQQLDILKVADVVFMLGGLATIKESIWEQVPIVIVPLGKDQRDNALRIKRTGVGVAAEVADLSPDDLRKLFTQATSSTWVRQAWRR